MENLKSIKWSLLLLQAYEYKEYKERHLLETIKELATINILSNLINDKNLFSDDEIKSAESFINTFYISDVEKNAFKKIMTYPYSETIFQSEISNMSEESCFEIFSYVTDIFITKNKLSDLEIKFIGELGNYLKIEKTTQSALIHDLQTSFLNLKLLLKNNSKAITRTKICKDIITYEFNNFKEQEIYYKSFFENKEYIISSIILIASILNLKIASQKILPLIWTPMILYKKDLKKASSLTSQLLAVYMRYEKIVDWNVVNLNNLIEKTTLNPEEKRSFKNVKESSITFTSKIIKHAFHNNEHKKISKFQRTLKN